MQETALRVFSHRFETLLDCFIKNIYSGRPFEKKMVIVPHLSMKSFLLQSLSQKLEIGAGLKIVTLSQAINLIFESSNKVFPKFLELSLAIQHEITGLEESALLAPLFKYLNAPSSSLRIGQLSDLLSLTFLDYGDYGGEFLKPWLDTSSWQQHLWKKVFSNSWTYPYQELMENVSSPYSFHLFGFHFIPALYLNFFKKMGSSFYFFSPCQSFWDDRFTQKELIRLKKGADINQKDHSPLLANLGKVGRKFFTNVLDQDLTFDEEYPSFSGTSLLEMVQRSIVEDQSPPDFKDGSIQIISASSKLHEIEILHETLVSLLEKNSLAPHEIAVFAPDINDYAPFVSAVFSKGILPYCISNLEISTLSPTFRAFKLLLNLPNEKFSKEALLQLFATSSFRDKFLLSSEDLTSIQSWVDQVGIRWGLDGKQRQLLLGQELADENFGTWDMGLTRLLWGIARAEEGIIPLCRNNLNNRVFAASALPQNSDLHSRLALKQWSLAPDQNFEEPSCKIPDSLSCFGISEIETFDKLLRIIASLKEDLQPLFDGTQRLIPDWIDYFVHLSRTYLNENEDLIKDFSHLRAMTSALRRNKVSYESIKRILSSIFEKKTGSRQETHLHGIKFSSLISGGIFPAKVLYVIGMEEGEFPRRKRKKLFQPEFDKEGDFHPTQTDEDRFLFLQLLLSARESLFLSYQRIAKEDQTELHPSVLIEELKAQIKSLSISHKSPSFYPEKKSSPLLPELYLPLKMERKPLSNPTLDLEKLISFAKHPLRFYFREVLQMGVAPFEKNEEEEEFILSPLFKNHLKQKAYKEPVEQLLLKSENKGELPRGLFKTIALQTVRTEIEGLEGYLRNFGIGKGEIHSQEIDLKMGEIRIEGKVEGIYQGGLLFHGENEIEDWVKVWPLFLVYLNGIQGSRPSIFFSKTGEKKDFIIQDPAASLQKYLEYYQLAQQYASPLLPKLAKPLLQGSAEELEKKIEEQLTSSFSYQDKALKWLYDRDKMMNCKAIFHNWVPILKGVHDFF